MFLEQIARQLKRDKKLESDNTYEIEFRKAELTFRHQVVYDPVSKKTIYLSPLPQDVSKEDVSFLGE